MIYTKRLLEQKEFRDILQEITEIEQDRIYCHHELEHMLDVCRIAWIIQLERALKEGNMPDPESDKDRLYLVGLLHDIGRAEQAKTGVHHTKTGREIAERLLEAIDCPDEWKQEILFMVEFHTGRDHDNFRMTQLAKDIFEADRISRNCFHCSAVDTCKWNRDEMNMSIDY